MQRPDVAILIPCYNEGATVAGVVESFTRALPRARVYFYDNDSSGATNNNAMVAGAIVRSESQQGKGAVVRRMS
jgi:glycosyltransferase involved in cell wall biosynthesis